MADPIQEPLLEEEEPQSEDLSDEALFDEASHEVEDVEKKEPETPEPPPELEKKEDQASGDDKKAVEDGKQKDGKGDEPVSTAAEIAEKRGKAIYQEPKQPAAQPPGEPAGQPPVKPGGVTKEQIANYLEGAGIDLESLPDGEIFVGNSSVNLKEFAEDNPEEFNAMIVLSNMMAENRAKQILENAGYVSKKEYDQFRSDLSGELQSERFWRTVNEVHPDGHSIIYNKEGKPGEVNKDFDDWLVKKPKHVQVLFNSPHPEDGIALLDYYKEEQAKKNVSSFDEKQREKKKKKDDLMKGTLRGKPGSAPKSQTIDDGEEDEEKLFQEACNAK